MNDLATLRKELRKTALQDRSRVGVETFIVEFNSFDKQIDREATLITFEVLVKHVSELLPLCQLASIDDQVALQHAYEILSHILCNLLRRFFLLSIKLLLLCILRRSKGRSPFIRLLVKYYLNLGHVKI